MHNRQILSKLQINKLTNSLWCSCCAISIHSIPLGDLKLLFSGIDAKLDGWTGCRIYFD